MKVLTRYLMRAVIMATVIVLFALLGIEFFINFSAELGSIGHGHYGVAQALYYTLLQMPAVLYQFFPLAGVVGALVGLGRLASTHELMVMRASGCSVFQILFAIVCGAVVMLVFVTALGEGVAPHLMQYALQYKADKIAHVHMHQKQLTNVWFTHENDFIHLDTIISKTHIAGVTLYHLSPNHQVTYIITAPQAQLSSQGWHLIHAKKKLILRTQTVIQALRHQFLQLTIKPQLLGRHLLPATEEDLLSLYQTAQYRKASGLSYRHLSYAFWQRLIQPLTSIVMMCLSLPFVFGGLRQASLGRRVMVGVLIGAGFYIANQFLGLFSMVFPISPLVAASFPTVIFCLLCVTLLRKI